MEYFVSSGEDGRRLCRLHAENDEESVTKAKEKFLKLVEFNQLSDNSNLTKVYRVPKNLLDKIYRLSITKETKKYSLRE